MVCRKSVKANRKQLNEILTISKLSASVKFRAHWLRLLYVKEHGTLCAGSRNENGNLFCFVFCFAPIIACFELHFFSDKMYRRLNSSAKSLNRKRRSSDSTPPITQFFNSVKRERSLSETKNDVSQKLEGENIISNSSTIFKISDGPTTTAQESHNQEKTGQNSDEELRNLLGVMPERELPHVPNFQVPASLENLPKNVYTHIFTILDSKFLTLGLAFEFPLPVNSVSALALTSNVMASHVKGYVAGHQFYRRIQMDHLDFVNSSIRPDDEEFQENDPFTACG